MFHCVLPDCGRVPAAGGEGSCQLPCPHPLLGQAAPGDLLLLWLGMELGACSSSGTWAWLPSWGAVGLSQKCAGAMDCPVWDLMAPVLHSPTFQPAPSCSSTRCFPCSSSFPISFILEIN